MAKIYPVRKGPVLYLDCMECEEQECTKPKSAQINSSKDDNEDTINEEK